MAREVLMNGCGLLVSTGASEPAVRCQPAAYQSRRDRKRVALEYAVGQGHGIHEAGNADTVEFLGQPRRRLGNFIDIRGLLRLRAASLSAPLGVRAPCLGFSFGTLVLSSIV